MRAPIDEFDLAKASLLSFFNQIEDSIVYRIGDVTKVDPETVDLLLGENGFTAKVGTYKRVLAAKPKASVAVERHKEFWSILEGLRIARNTFAHGTQHMVSTEQGVLHVYAAHRTMRRGEFSRSMAVDTLPLCQRLAATMHLLLSSIVSTEAQDAEFFDIAFEKARAEWAALEAHLPQGSSLKWPPKSVDFREGAID